MNVDLLTGQQMMVDALHALLRTARSLLNCATAVCKG
jgi:hypothetical protein